MSLPGLYISGAVIRHRKRRAESLAGLVGAVAAALAWSVVSAGPALAHASLTTATPAPGSRADVAPASVTLSFPEAVDLSSRSIEVLDPEGRHVDIGGPFHPSGEATSLAVKLRDDLPRGVYTVVWRVASADSHPAASSYAFGVGVTPPPLRADVDASASTSLRVAHGLARMLSLVSAAVLVGGVFFCLAIWPAGRDSKRARALIHRSWLAALASTCALLLAQGPYAAGGGLTGVADVSLLEATVSTRYGQLLVLRLGLLVVVGMVLRQCLDGLRRPAVAGWLGVAFVFTFSSAEHSGQGDLTAVAIPSDMAHTLAASVWLGGLCMLFTALRGPAGVDSDAHDVLRRWSRAAMSAVAVLVVTGIFQAWREVRYLDALRGTGYGRLLIGKLIFVAATLAVAAGARAVTLRLGVSPRWRRSSTVARTTPGRDVITVVPHAPTAGIQSADAATTGIGGAVAAVSAPPVDASPADEHALQTLRRRVLLESAFGLVVLVVTALLVDSIPARVSYDVPFSARATATNAAGDTAPVIIDIDSTRVGVTAMHVYAYTSYGDPLPLASVSAFLAPAAGGPVTRTELPYAERGHAATDAVLIPRPGTWTITVQLTTGDGTTLTAKATYGVRG